MRNPASRRLRIATLVAAMSVAVVAQAQPQQASPSQPQQSSQNPDSVADAARRSKVEKDAPKARTVFTDDDVSSLKGPVSVVGEDRTSTPPSDTTKPDAKPLPSEGPKAAQNDEKYWRDRYRALRQKMDALDKQIADKQEEIQKYGKGAASADSLKVNSCTPLAQRPGNGGLPGCYVPEVDRQSQLKDLERKKADVQNQMDQLQEEGRKAGADPGWFR